jgi:hypothetical protein
MANKVKNRLRKNTIPREGIKSIELCGKNIMVSFIYTRKSFLKAKNRLIEETVLFGRLKLEN